MQEAKSMNETELRALLSGLRVSKQKGELDTDERLARQTVKWRDALEYSVLEACARHRSEECRLEMLALLVESKKSTLHFTRMELDVILLFLGYNLCEKMEYVPLVKKALKRLKDSLAVMRRRLSQELKMRSRYEEQDAACEMYEDALAQSRQTSGQIERDVQDYVTFFVNLRETCVGNLYPDATYDRRRSSLQILLLAQELLCDEFKDAEWEREQAETIFQCLLLDTYEPNKEMAYRIIKPLSPVLLRLDSEPRVRLIIQVALKLGSSVRPIDSATAAYMLKLSKLSPVIKSILCDYCTVEDNVAEATTLQLVLLLYRKLQEALVLAKKNIGMAIVKNSLYGYLFCIKSLLVDCDLRDTGTSELWQSTVANVILLCLELNHTVSVVVNNSSPEGHLPMDLKALSLDDASFPEKEIVTPQMVLLCSWRTVKEASQLFGLFATKASIQTSESLNGLLTEEQIERVMKHLVSLLCETKHRGAFEQAYVGFHQLCTRLWRLTNTALNALPMHWLHDILVGITGLMPGYTKLCATRRSAGVPFLIQAVLSSEPKVRNNSGVSAFHSVMKILLQFSQLESTVNLWHQVKSIMYRNTVFSTYEHLAEPIVEDGSEYGEVKLDMTEIKTHSMNILRALFRHSQLGDVVKCYIADGLMVAFRNYESRTWAILEIFRRLPSIRVQLLKSDVANFIRATDWVLNGLERRRAVRLSCFLIASVYIDILHELYNLDKNMIESCNMEDILHILQQHLVEKDLLRQEPGEEMYKVSAIKFILCVENRSNFLQTVHNGQSKAFSIYSQLLIVPEAETQSIAWSTVFEVLKKGSHRQRKLLSTYAIRAAADFAKDLYKYNPKLQDAVCDFLYNSLMDTNECYLNDKREICNLVLRKMHLHDAKNIYSQRVNYLRLLGKCMTTLTHELKEEELRTGHIEDIYRKVCDNSWVGSLRKDFRLTVLDILYELFERDIGAEYCHPALDWWTMLLQLLVDDNADIRRDASKLMYRLKLCNELECIEKTLSAFFQSFSEMVADKYPGIAVGALFCWSVSLLGDTDYEMDESDVFNKCRNYDVFEPVRISKLCFDLTKSITQRYSIDNALPPDVVRWINFRLDTDFPALSSFKEIVRNYRSNQPTLEKELEEILDPTYRDKLLQVLACEQYVVMMSDKL
ncbi:PREDICTED: thyroid adenoma-associated protein homolog isoform X2 [Vollenhovia emeryi]|uniref:thyroid adenoma-associated protein homolog isoform X2 n=1 Tax=Vollenhovia emeryi TaxID=411798 RepID=UPI0005F4032A|nr:PREDICTED: thyroid adenoma-associated protein homolog isoform X2 [Vollenhovia emeryi]